MAAHFDIGIARMVHLQWELDLEAMAKGSRSASSLQSHEDCELGLWLHQTGVKKYHKTDAIRQLVDAHRTFHVIANRVVSHVQNGRWGVVDKDLQEVQAISRDIVFMLTVVEFSSLEKQRGFRLLPLPKPIRGLLRQLFEMPVRKPQDRDCTELEVSRARLMHFRWSRDLLQAFNPESQFSLEPAESCDLGIWIHAVGLKRHEKMATMLLLDQAHKAFHLRAKEVLSALKVKKYDQADKIYAEMLQFSQEVVYLLSMVELQLQHTGSIAPTVRVMG